MASAHEAALMMARNSQDRRIHELLMNNPLPGLMDVYQPIFADILGERVSDVGPLLVDVKRQLDRANRAGRPLLFIVTQFGWSNVPSLPLQTRQILNEYTVLPIPLRAAPAVSQLTGQPPFECSASTGQCIVVTRSDGSQVASFNDWNNLQQVNEALASGWIESMVSKPPTLNKQLRAERLLKKVSPEGTDWGLKLKRSIDEKRAAPEDVEVPENRFIDA